MPPSQTRGSKAAGEELLKDREERENDNNSSSQTSKEKRPRKHPRLSGGHQKAINILGRRITIEKRWRLLEGRALIRTKLSIESAQTLTKSTLDCDGLPTA